MEGNSSMEWEIFGMEWKKIASMEYGKTVFHFIPLLWSEVNPSNMQLSLKSKK